MFPSVYHKGILKILAAIFIAIYSLNSLQAQKIDSIYFNLYTDSLKKGTFNYINVDGKTTEGIWMPLTSKEIKFSSSAGKFDGNSLFIDSACKEEKVIVKVFLKSNPGIAREIIIYIKKFEIVEKIKTKEEFLNSPPFQNPNKSVRGYS